MPPKRKLETTTSTEPTTRTTRGSARIKDATVKKEANEKVINKPAAKRAAKKAIPQDAGDESVEEQPKKKAKTTKTTTGRGRKAAKNPDQESSATVNDDEDPKVKQSKSSSITHVGSPTPPKTVAPHKSKPVQPIKEEPYTLQRALSLFEKYADPDEQNVISPEGFEKLCNDAGLPMEGSMPLLLAWQMEAQELAKISKQEWLKGTGNLRVSSLSQLLAVLTDLENLLVLAKPVNKQSKNDRYRSYTTKVKDAFHDFYMFSFMLVKPPTSKNIEMETAIAFWSVLLTPKYPLMKDVISYINEKGTYRATNKDLWTMMLEFCETVTPNLEGYDADGAWPTLIDEFVSWKMTNQTTI